MRAAMSVCALGIVALSFACRDDKPEKPAASGVKDRSAWRRTDASLAPGVPSVAASTNRQALAIDAGAVEQPPADRRLEPIPGWNPTHATIRLLRKVALGEWDQGDLISDQRGLVIINNLDGPLAGKRYCGAGLSEGSRQAMAAFQDLLDRLDLDGVESVRCSNEPRPPSCITTELGHQGAIYFRFADGERGIELAAIYRLALSALSDLPDDRVVAHEKAVVAAADEEMRRLSAQPCSAAK